MIKIKIKKEYWLEGGPRGSFTIFLPCEGGKKSLIPELAGTGEKIWVLDGILGPFWGWEWEKFPEYRYMSRGIKGKTWEEVRQKIDELEEISIDALYRALDRYKSLQASHPADEEYEVVLR